MKRFCVPLVMALVLSTTAGRTDAQTGVDGDVWRTLAEKLEAGTAIDMRLRDGKHLKSTFIAARPDAMLVQRRTRIPVPVEEISYDSIATLSRVQPSSLSGGKAAAIALGSAGAAVGTLVLILLAAFD